MPFEEWNGAEDETKDAPIKDNGGLNLDETADETDEENDPIKSDGEQNAMPFSEERYTFMDLTGKNRPGNSTLSFASIGSGVLSVIFGFCRVETVGLIFALVAVACALLSRKRQGYFDGKSIAGLFLGIFGAVTAVAFWILEAVEAANQRTDPDTDPVKKTAEGLSAFRKNNW